MIHSNTTAIVLRTACYTLYSTHGNNTASSIVVVQVVLNPKRAAVIVVLFHYLCRIIERYSTWSACSPNNITNPKQTPCLRSTYSSSRRLYPADLYTLSDEPAGEGGSWRSRPREDSKSSAEKPSE